LVQKSTIVYPLDKCNVNSVNVFHLYYGFNRKFSFSGDFIKSSIRSVEPESLLNKKSKVKGMVIRTKYPIKKKDGSFLKFTTNNVILLKKRMNSYGVRLGGPVPFQIKRKKFVNSFPGII